jgi:molecular chaperone HscB
VADHFETLGVARTFRLDETALETRYRELSRLLHPDRHAAGGPTARRLALEKTIAVNDAYRALKDPARRAGYLLQLHGIDLGEGGAHGAGKYLPPGFLMEVMELREAFDEARSGKRTADVEKLAANARGDRQRALDAMGAAFDRNDHEEAARQLAVLRYYDRFLGEVRAWEDEAFEENHG